MFFALVFSKLKQVFLFRHGTNGCFTIRYIIVGRRCCRIHCSYLYLNLRSMLSEIVAHRGF
ncbi:hypothetical protein Hanom_Chr02g00150921 [Helianthus anomalus]